MAGQLVNIRTDSFTKQEMRVIEDSLKEWEAQWIVDIVYVGEGNNDTLDVSFTLEENNLGEFLHIIFGCGYQFAYTR